MPKNSNRFVKITLLTGLALLLPFALTGCIPDLNDPSFGTNTYTETPTTVNHYERSAGLSKSQSTSYYDGAASRIPQHHREFSDMQSALEHTRRLDEARIRQQEAELRLQQQHFDEAARHERMRIQADNLRRERLLAEERERQYREREAYQARQRRYQQEQAYFKKQQADNRIAKERAEQAAALAQSRSRAQEWQIEAQRARLQNGGNEQVIEGYGAAGLSDREKRLRESEARALERSRARIAREGAAQ